MSADLDAAARRAGILLEPRWGGAPPVPDATKEALIALLGEAPSHAADPGGQAYVPPIVDEKPLFGVALQLYQLRSPRNLGIGDLADLRALLPTLAGAGAAFVGLNPLHALFMAAPERASPFSPSDRRFLNPMIIAVEDVDGYAPDMRADVSVPASDEAIDYTAAATAKRTVLAAIHTRWRESGVPASVAADYQRFLDDGADALQRFATFEALSDHMVRSGYEAGWTSWPEGYRTADAPAVAAFAAEHREAIAFHVFLQFYADRQLRAAHQAALGAGMALGLYLDLAVGVAPDGAATWAEPDLVMRGVRIGAPPDLFSTGGQDWGLAPFSPAALIANGFAPYRQMLDAVMTHAGAMRIDHAMGLERLFLIPDGMDALDGAYVTTPGLVDALAQASMERETLTIGEDLGVVPAGFRDRMGDRRIFSMRILPFEWEGEAMREPSTYPADSLACLSTHDIAPLAAFWDGTDIDLRHRLGHIERADRERAHADRRRDVEALLALAGLPPDDARQPLSRGALVALHAVAARTASRLLAIRLEDVVGGHRLVNLPGTDREHPNWRHTLPLTVDGIIASEALAQTLAAVQRIRG